MNTKNLAEIVIRHVRGFVQPALDSLAKQVNDALESMRSYIDRRFAELPTPVDGKPGERGEPGKDGKDGKDGIDGKDGKDVSIEEIKALIDELPKPRDGKDGANGKDGIDGKDGASVSLDDVLKAIEPRVIDMQERIEGAIKSIPKPKDGIDGKDGKSVTVEEVMKELGSHIARWEVDFERRAQALFQKAVDNMPKPKDGRDGLDLRNFSAELDADGRTVLMTLKDDERTEHVHLTFPIVIDRGVYNQSGVRPDGGLYEKGDGVTYGGCFWIAQNDAPEGKPGQSKDWRLAVKKGRDGKDGKEPTPTKPVKI